MKHLGTTSPFRGPAGEILPGSIAEIPYVYLGGPGMTEIVFSVNSMRH